MKNNLIIYGTYRYFGVLIVLFSLTSFILPVTLAAGGDKPEGFSFKGIPLISYNDDDGFGYGARIYLTDFNPEYEPFRWQIWAQYYKTTKKRENHEIRADVLDFLGSGFRVKIHGGYVRFQSAQYYGIGNYQDMQRIEKIRTGEIPHNENLPAIPDLVQLDNDLFKEELTLNESAVPYLLSGQPLPDSAINPGRRVLRERQNKYYIYDRVEPFILLSSEDWIGNSDFKLFAGIKGTRYRINSYYGDHDDGEAEPNGRTLIDLEQPTGYDAIGNRKFVNQLRLALVYDSRPRIRELNPNSGVFTDLHLAASGSALGSHYTFQKVTFTFRHYLEIFKSFFEGRNEELVMAYRLLVQETFGDAPFFEMNRILTKEEESEGLGGTFGLRGYPSNQFVDRIMSLGNSELRWTFSRKDWLGGMDWVLLAYYDVGRVAAHREELDLKGWHKAWGGGIRLVWQGDMVINISQGFSRYESFLTFSFGHTF